MGGAVVAVLGTLLGSVLGYVSQGRQAAKSRTWLVEDRDAAAAALQQRWEREVRDRREVTLRSERLEVYREVMRASDALKAGVFIERSRRATPLGESPTPEATAERVEQIKQWTSMVREYGVAVSEVAIVADERVSAALRPVGEAMVEVLNLIKAAASVEEVIVAVNVVSTASTGLVQAMREDLTTDFIALSRLGNK